MALSGLVAMWVMNGLNAGIAIGVLAGFGIGTLIGLLNFGLIRFGCIPPMIAMLASVFLCLLTNLLKIFNLSPAPRSIMTGLIIVAVIFASGERLKRA